MKYLATLVYCFLLGSASLLPLQPYLSSDEPCDDTLPPPQSIAFETAAIHTKDVQTARLNWIKSYKEGVEAAQKARLPIYLLFTGPEWCYYCQQMESKILTQPGFIDKVDGKFIFVEIVLPPNRDYPLEVSNLMRRFEVRSVPTSIILSSDGQEQLGRFGYPRTTPEEYAESVLQTVKK